MLIGISFITCSLIYMLLLCIVYFTKKRIKTIETTIYAQLLILNVIGLTLELLCCYTVKNMDLIPIFNIIANRSYLIYFATFVTLFTVYIYVVCNKNNEINKSEIIKFNKIEKIVIGVIYVVLLLFVIALPLKYYNESNAVYSYGLAVDVLTLACSLFMVLDFVCIFVNLKKLNKKKLIPMFALLVCFAMSFMIRHINPGIILITCSFAFVTAIMYFTIENPDVKMIEQLELAKEQADKANHAKTDFLSSMSHEIRTPLNAIVGFSDCIKNSDSLDEAKENADDIINASNTLLEIVNGILDISKIEAGRLEIVNSDYNAYDLFSGLAKLVTPKMNEKALDFQVSIAEDLPTTLYGDHANIKKVITNLLSNAYKYTEKGFVRYEVKCVNNNGICRLIVSVEDSGRGIKKEDIDKLFTKFQRVDEDRNTTIEGTGLGLAITKQLLEMMGGNIVVNSTYGEGSKFIITLDQRIDNVVLEEDKVNSDTIDLTGKRILVVDDNTLNLKVATKLLERYNANVDVCDSGFGCISKITAGEEYDLILMDDMMPKMSGTETFKKLKESSSFNTPVIVLTANAITGMKDKYLNDGFDDYLAKPIEKEAMIIAFNKIFKNVSSKEKVSVVEEINNNSDFLEANGIDVKHGLELLGDISLYNDTMNDFINEMESRLLELDKYKTTSDMANYAILVHAIKSDCKYLGIMDLADIAYQHELKSKDNDIAFVNSNYDELIGKIEDYVTICKKYLGRD